MQPGSGFFELAEDLGYSWLAVGVIGGWAARTQSIWPSLASATIWNAIMIVWVL